jgi:hypothetical protein
MTAILDFGKYKGKSLAEIMLHDPDYVFWALDNNIFGQRLLLAAKASELALKATSIKIPVDDPASWCVVYLCDRRGTLTDLRIIPKFRLKDYAEEYSSDCIDLSVPRKWKNYDKLGGRIMLRVIRKLFFNDEHARLTKKRCEEFFDDPKNFVRL